MTESEKTTKTDLKPGADAVLPLESDGSGPQLSMEELLAIPLPNDAVYSALIVDDNPSFQKLLSLSLSMQPQIGVIDFANNGVEAIIKAKEKLYDLVFMDAMMPGIDGYEACRQLREIPEYKHTPIIMVTGLNSPMDEAKGIIAGTTTYVTKPVQQMPFKVLLTRELALLNFKKKLRKPDK